MVTQEPSATATPQALRPLALSTVLTRLVWWCMVPLVVLAGVLAVENVRDRRAAVDVSANDLVRDVARAVDERLWERIRALSVLAGSPLLDSPARWGEFHAAAQAYGQVFPNSNVILADAAGAMLMHSQRPWGSALPAMPRPDGRAAAPLALQSGLPAVGDPVLGPVAQRRLVAIAVPVLHGPRRDLVLLTTLDAQRLQQIVDDNRVPPHGRLSILDSTGAVVAQVPSQPEVPAVDFSEAGQFRVALTQAPWSVRLETPRSESMAPVLQGSLKLGLVIVATSLLGMVGGGVAARRLARSVATLARPTAATPEQREVVEIAEARRQLLATMQARDDALRSLGEREATFDAMFNGMPEAVIFADTDRVIRMVNPAFTRIFGYQASQAIGRTSEFLFADPAEAAAQAGLGFNADADADATPGAEPRQARCRRADGTEFWCESRDMPIVGADGEVSGMLGLHRDITDARRAETALVESNEYFAAVFRTSPVGIAVARLDDGAFIDINPAMEALLGHPRDEALGKSSGDLGIWVQPAERADLMDALRTVGLAEAREGQFRRKSGEVIDVSYAGCKVDLKGVPCFVGMAMDISAQKKASRELENQQATLEALVERRTADLSRAYGSLEESTRFIRLITDSLPGRVSYWDADLRCRFANKTYLDWSGKPVSQVLDATMAESLSPDYFAAALPYAREALRGRPQQFEFASRKDGVDHVHQLIYVPDLVSDGQARGLFAIAFDITALKRSEAELRQLNADLLLARDQADAATRAKSAFLANMSHEIRTPMNAIIGLTHLLRGSATSPEQHDRLRKIDMAGRHLLSIINDILDISKIEADRVQLEHTDFHLSAVLDNVVSLIGEQARSKKLVLEVDTDSVPLWLRGDPTRLRQAVLNYASNAIKFTEQGSVTLRAILLHDDGDRLLVRFEVQDTGIGIGADALPGLFQYFGQGDESIARKHGGTGLGLAITRRLAELMGGQADVDSQPGVGSTFWFTAQLGRGHGVMPEVSDPARADAETMLRQIQGSPRLLLADDNEINREVALELLHAVGLSADTAETGRQAVAMAAARRYDLILMDVNMPEMDGLTATRTIRAMPGMAQVPIIAKTANAFVEDRRACEQAGMSDVVTKPVEAAALYATLLKWLSRPQPAEVPAPGGAQARLAAAEAEGPPTGLPPQLAGFDLPLGLKYCRGDASFYLRMLRKFRDDHVVSFRDDFGAACRRGDWQAAARLAHTLKGLAASLGAVALSDMAGRLEKATSQRQDALIGTIEAEVDAELRPMLAGLGALSEPPGQSRP